MKKSNLLKQVFSDLNPNPKVQAARDFVRDLSNKEAEKYWLMKRYRIDEFEVHSDLLKLDLQTFKHEINMKYRDYKEMLQ